MHGSSTGPVTVAADRGGRAAAALVWEGSGPNVVLLHPNGLCAGVFEPLVERLAVEARVVAVDLPGHGTSGPPEEWSFVAAAEDVWSVLDELGVQRPVVLGASLGGAVGVLLDAVRPGHVEQLLLAEPLAVPADPPGGGELVGGEVSAARARRRRDGWTDRIEAEEWFAARPTFATLDPAVLDAYLRHGLVPDGDGCLSLRCRPESEASWFEATWRVSGGPSAWEHLPRLSCTARVLAGTTSNLPRPWFDAIAARAGTLLELVDGAHLFLFEATGSAAALVRGALDET
jgi:pimeloyl-ACP methyl ester carboxylesterase